MLQHFIYVMCSFVQKGFEFKFNLKMSFKNLLKNKKGNPFPPFLFRPALPSWLLPPFFPSLSLTLGPTDQFLPSSPATAPSPSHAREQRLEPKPSAPHSHSSTPRPLRPVPRPHLRSTCTRAAFLVPISPSFPLSLSLRQAEKRHWSRRDPPHTMPSNRAISLPIFALVSSTPSPCSSRSNSARFGAS